MINPFKTTRQQFTEMVAILLTEMIKQGEKPVIDFVLRSASEQQRLFNAGKSKLDGINKKSKHQVGKAVDIYLSNPDGSVQFVWDRDKAEKWHKVWKELGGASMIVWDLGHYEI